MDTMESPANTGISLQSSTNRSQRNRTTTPPNQKDGSQKKKRRRLTLEQQGQIIQALKNGDGVKHESLAKEYGVGRSTISRILTRGDRICAELLECEYRNIEPTKKRITLTSGKNKNSKKETPKSSAVEPPPSSEPPEDVGPKKKHKRQRLTLAQQGSIVEALKAGEKQRALAAKYGVRRCTISKIRSRGDFITTELEELKSRNIEPNMTRVVVTTNYPFKDVDAATYLWIQRAHKSQSKINCEMIKTKAAKFAQVLGIADDVSNGWLRGFLKRYGIKSNGEKRPIKLDSASILPQDEAACVAAAANDGLMDGLAPMNEIESDDEQIILQQLNLLQEQENNNENSPESTKTSSTEKPKAKKQSSVDSDSDDEQTMVQQRKMPQPDTNNEHPKSSKFASEEAKEKKPVPTSEELACALSTLIWYAQSVNGKNRRARLMNAIDGLRAEVPVQIPVQLKQCSIRSFFNKKP